MTTSPTPMVGVDEEENWQTPQSDGVEMRDPGSVTGKRTRNDQSPEEDRGREVTSSIKQEMIEESLTMQADRVVRRQKGLSTSPTQMRKVRVTRKKERILKRKTVQKSRQMTYTEMGTPTAVKGETKHP